MGIAEHREAIGPQFDTSPHGVEAGRNGLVRQAVEEVEVDAGDAGLPQVFDCGLRLRETLDAVDRLLDHGIETLHAEAHPVDPAEGERAHHRRRERAWIDLDGDVRRRDNAEGMPDRAHQVGERLRRHDGRRAAAEMDMLDAQATPDLRRDQVDLAAERRLIDRNRLVALGHCGAAAAIPAHRATERHVKVKRGAGTLRDGFQPIGLARGTDR